MASVLLVKKGPTKIPTQGHVETQDTTSGHFLKNLKSRHNICLTITFDKPVFFSMLKTSFVLVRFLRNRVSGAFSLLKLKLVFSMFVPVISELKSVLRLKIFLKTDPEISSQRQRIPAAALTRLSSSYFHDMNYPTNCPTLQTTVEMPIEVRGYR